MTPSVQMVGITHQFGGLTAVDAVDFEVAPNTLHALVGENGAGKTTLVRVLYGALHPAAGSIILDGTERTWRSAAEAIAHGIGMVSQHYSVIPELTCLQNLVLGAEGSFILPRAEMQARAEVFAEKMGFQFDWNEEAVALSPASAQKLEIVKLLWRNSKIMILDEPTAMLSPADSELLYKSLRQLANEGAAVIVVTHRISEVIQHCDSVTVLRGGRKIADSKVSETTADELAGLIVGHDVTAFENVPIQPGETTLDVKNIIVKGVRKDDALKGATFTIQRGEVVGLAGVDGNGQRELFRSLVGTLPIASGEISLNREDVTHRPARDRLALGVRLIPEDRHEEGLIEDWSLIDNAALGLQRMPPLSNGAMSNLQSRLSVATRIADRFKTKHTGLHKPMRSLSGGNQQRFVAARALELDPQLILAFQPTRGLDIDGAAQVYQSIRNECRKGAAALIVSFDLDELLEFCDRVLVINAGVVHQPPQGQERDRQAIGRLMVGAQ